MLHIIIVPKSTELGIMYTCIFSNKNPRALIFSVPHFPVLLMETVLLLSQGGNLRFSVTFLHTNAPECTLYTSYRMRMPAYECMSCTLHTATCMLHFILVPVQYSRAQKNVGSSITV